MQRLPRKDLQHILDNTKDIWSNVKGISVFLTGGTGFFGKWLLESFVYINRELQLNSSITVLTRDKSRFSTELSILQIRTFCILR
jgi:dTDP-glucose 4,6-dehydratase